MIKQAKLLSEAIKLRQQVPTDDPVNFQPERLSKTWLWREKYHQDHIATSNIRDKDTDNFVAFNSKSRKIEDKDRYLRNIHYFCQRFIC